MKKYKKIISFISILFISMSIILTACSDKSNQEGVDLRFEELGKQIMEDFYQVDAEGLTNIELRVKSSHPWKVFGSQNWHAITPSEGEANEATTINISCDKNATLDDREDQIHIQSDYLIGKTFTIIQKGIAYLRTDLPDNNILKDNEEGLFSFKIQANQGWTIEIEEGNSWLSVKENSSGGTNMVDSETEVKLEFEANNGEERIGKIILYDRNHADETKIEILCKQEGIILLPIIPEAHQEYGYFRITDYQSSTLTIDVESNGEWSVAKENNSDGWYSLIGNTDFVGNGTIQLQLEENDLNTVRIANLILKTKEIAGAEVATKTVTIKQANLPKPEKTILDGGGISSWAGSDLVIPQANGSLFSDAEISKDGFKPGIFKLHVSGGNASSRPYLYLKYKDAEGATVEHEIRIGVNNTAAASKLWTFVTPWGFGGPPVANWYNSNFGALNMTHPHTLELRLSDNDGYMKIEYVLNGNLAHDYIANGKDRVSSVNGVACFGAYIMPYDSTVRVRLGCNGDALFEWFEYTPRVDWQD